MSENQLACVPGLLGFLSLTAALAGGLWCQMLEIDTKLSRENSTISELKYKFGLFHARQFEYVYLNEDSRGSDGITIYYANTCYRNPTTQQDMFWVAAQGLQLASWIFAVLLLFALFVALCNQGSRTLYRTIGGIYICIVASCQGLIFLLLRSNACTHNPHLWQNQLLIPSNSTWTFVFDSQCSLSAGSALVILSIIGYFFTGVACCLYGDPCEEGEEKNVLSPERASPR